MSDTQTLIRESYDDALLPTDLVWKPRAVSNVRPSGALVGTLYGIEVDGMSTGRGVAYQIALLDGEVRTVWWNGTIARDGRNGEGPAYPHLFDVDTYERVLRNPMAVAWFSRLEDVQPDRTEGDAR